MRRGQEYGFTLIEMMITLAVLAVLILMVVPSFADMIERSRLRGATDDLVTLLGTSRANAIKLQRDVNVSLGGSASGAWCAGASSALDPALTQPVPAAAKCDCNTAGACLVNGQAAAFDSSVYKGVTLSSVKLSSTTADGSVTFNSKSGGLDPLTTLAAVTVMSKTGRFQTQVNVSALGQVQACVPTGKPVFSGFPQC